MAVEQTRSRQRAQRRPAWPGRQLRRFWLRNSAALWIAQRRPAWPGRQLTRSRRVERQRRSLNEGRPGRAGNCTAPSSLALCGSAAQRRPAWPGRQLDKILRFALSDIVRSTKAGLAGPATAASALTGTITVDPLNEGRPGRAGNCAHTSSRVSTTELAQRRPAWPGRQLCPTSILGALRHMGNTSIYAKGIKKHPSHL